MRAETASVRALSYALARISRARPQRDGDRPVATVGAWRLVRGLAVGGVATGLAWTGHVWAGGEPPALLLLLTAAVGVGVASVALSGYRWAPPALMALLLAVQVLLHQLFDQATPDGLVHPAGHPAGHLAAGPPADGAMTVAHVLAAAATAWVLARGEDWLWLLLELLALRATRLLRPPHLALGPDAPAFTPAWAPSRPRVGLGGWSLRGPPVVSR